MAVRLSLVQLGKGTIGTALVEQIREQRAALLKRLGVDLVYAGIAGRGSGAFDAEGLDLDRWRERVESGDLDGGRIVKRALGALSGSAILIDATAEEGMVPLYEEALSAGLHVVSCNKKPLTGPMSEYVRVKEAARKKRRFWLYEVSVGAGLPVIGTLRDLLDSGDRLASIEGCFSGTLNFLCTGLDAGEKFSRVLARAREMGYTEPDPRDDLGGMDVARKALILAREAGLAIEPEEVRLEPFCPIDRSGDVEAFMAEAPGLDDAVSRHWKSAADRGRRLRYVARVDEACAASLVETPADGALGRLNGPGNIFVFTTKRYSKSPLVVSGPGAGPAVTAAGAFADILRIARAIVRTS